MSAENGAELMKAIEISLLYEKSVTQIFTLAIEYEAKTITAERFADRVCTILRTFQAQSTDKAKASA